MACMSCVKQPGVSAPPHHGGHGGGHFGRGRAHGGRRFFDWPHWWGPEVIVEPSSCTWMPPTGRVPPSVIAALARKPFVNGWRTVFDSGWWAEQQNPNLYFVCVVASNAIGLYGLGQTNTELPAYQRAGASYRGSSPESAGSSHMGPVWPVGRPTMRGGFHGLGEAPTLEDVRRRAVETAYPTRDIRGWDIWAEDPKVEPIYQGFLLQFGLKDPMTLAQHEAEERLTMPATSFPVWPMVAVGVVAVGLFVATLAIKKAG